MAENKKNKQRAVPDPWGGWDTTDPKYIVDVKKELDSYFEKNIEEPYEPPLAKALDPNACQICGNLDCEGAPRFKGICSLDKRFNNGMPRVSPARLQYLAGIKGSEEPASEPDPGNYCDDCREGKPHQMTTAAHFPSGEKFQVRVHRHAELTPAPMTHSEATKELEKLLTELKEIKCHHSAKGSCDKCTEPAEKLQAYAYTGYNDIDEFLNECLDTMRRKGHDYRQGNDDDLLHNFRSVGLAVDEDMMKVWFTYFYKHYSAVVTYIKEGGQSESEPIDGRIKDMIVYLLLFYRMTQERGRQMHGVIS